MEYNAFNTETENNGNVNISDEVISVIAALAASEVKGIAGMAGSFSGGLSELLGKKNLSKGVKLTVNEKNISLDLSVIAEYGAVIPDVAWQLQEKVKNEVEAMTGMTVTDVNISVDGINVPKDEKTDSAKKNHKSENQTAEAKEETGTLEINTEENSTNDEQKKG